MFSEFRQSVKKCLTKRRMTYQELSVISNVSESTIKCFMCGASNSRRVAEQIADALERKLEYSNGIFKLI